MNVQAFDPKGLTDNPDIHLTAAAIAHFQRQLEKSPATAVRLFIEESGCSGYMYRVELVSEGEADDLVLPQDDSFTLYVQRSALAILQGTQVDFKKDGLNEVIKFNNPNVTGECGCGESFVVEPD